MNDNTQNPQTIVAWIQATPFRQHITILIFVFIALAMVAKTVLLFKEASQVGQAEFSPQYINVSGKAETFIKPDTLQFTVTVNEDGKDAAEATAKAGAKITKALAILKANGVEEKNIKTTSYSTVDTYDTVSYPCPQDAAVSSFAPAVKSIATPACRNTSSVVSGATVYQTLEVKIKDIEKNATTEKRGKLIGELSASNIKTEGFTFTVFDLDTVKTEVRAEAIAKAKADAKVLARNLGVDLSDVVGFNEQGDGGYNPYMSARADMVMEKESSAPVVQLPAGEQKVTSMVTLTYLLK